MHHVRDQVGEATDEKDLENGEAVPSGSAS
jgi:hypothetical protein